jgi:hypothetical protein
MLREWFYNGDEREVSGIIAAMMLEIMIPLV